MNIFTDYSYYANQLWIGARYMESLTLFIAFSMINKNADVGLGRYFLIYTMATAALILSIFVFRVFPVCYIENVGQTAFKQISEYIICVILALSLLILHKNKDNFDSVIYGYLFYSIISTIIAELAFTFYISNYGLSNIVGHYFKIFSFYLIYKAIIQTGILEPTSIIFREIDALNIQLKEELEINREQNRKNERLINELQNALDHVKQLRGLLPICMHCKKIRDDSGYWSQIETYISLHSDVDFSHSICPDCVALHYPELQDKKHKS